MKNVGLLICVGVACSQLHAQDAECKKCTPQNLGTTFIANVYPDKKNVIESNWIDFFGVDLEREMPWTGKNPLVTIKLDAHGCVYPPFADIIDKDDFIDDSLKTKRFFKHSFYNLFADKRSTRKVIELMSRQKYDPQLIESVRDLSDIATLKISDEELIEREFLFRKKWNELFLTPKIKEIDSVYLTTGSSGVLFFIAGFNVPYSLQHIQGNFLFKKVEDAGQSEKVVLIRYIWPSESRKKLKFEPVVEYRDRKSLGTQMANKYVANRSYVAGLTLRDIVNNIKANNIYLMSHSHGAVVATSLLMHPQSKIRNMGTVINKKLIEEFNSNLRPGIRVRAFLSAPGLPGENTFETLDSIRGRNYQFFVGYNNRDEVLLKRFYGLPPTPKWNSSTTLGCNWRNEVMKTERVFENKLIAKNLVAKPSGNQRTHDIFCYATKYGFNSLLQEFVNSWQER